MRIHLVSLIGGYAEILPFMLDHYREAGIESCALNVHVASDADPVLDTVRREASRVGARVESILRGDWQSQQERVWRASMQARADEWCVLADQDELHVYPDSLRALLEFCDRRGYDFVTGAFVDRVAADGGFPPVDRRSPLWAQFPLGGLVSYRALGADPRKVVAAKGRVLVTKGQHLALTGAGCPIEDAFVQVHHFKWTAGLAERLGKRAASLRANSVGHWFESDNFVRYYDAHDGRIDVDDPRFLFARCAPDYPHWPRVVEMARAHRSSGAV